MLAQQTLPQTPHLNAYLSHWGTKKYDSAATMFEIGELGRSNNTNAIPVLLDALKAQCDHRHIWMSAQSSLIKHGEAAVRAVVNALIQEPTPPIMERGPSIIAHEFHEGRLVLQFSVIANPPFLASHQPQYFQELADGFNYALQAHNEQQREKIPLDPDFIQSNMPAISSSGGFLALADDNRFFLIRNHKRSNPDFSISDVYLLNDEILFKETVQALSATINERRTTDYARYQALKVLVGLSPEEAIKQGSPLAIKYAGYDHSYIDQDGRLPYSSFGKLVESARWNNEHEKEQRARAREIRKK